MSKKPGKKIKGNRTVVNSTETSTGEMVITNLQYLKKHTQTFEKLNESLRSKKKG